MIGRRALPTEKATWPVSTKRELSHAERRTRV